MKKISGKSMQSGIALITYKARKLLERSLPPLLATGYPVLVVNSSSNDGTAEFASSLGASTLVIPRNEYNHGTTRELARKVLKTPLVLFATPDAILKDPESVELLLEPIRSGEACASFARQLPHEGADFYEAFPREFGYGEKSYLTETFPFLSNSFSAYRNSSLDEIGGFTDTIAGEDAIAAAKLLRLKKRIAYVAECKVHHSHSYTLFEEFQRAFDTGYYRKKEEELFSLFEKEEKRGIQFAKEMLKRRPLPYTFLYLFARYGGFLLGKRHARLPKKWVAALSAQEFYHINSEE